MESVLSLFDADLLAATIRVATPIALVAVGVAICNKAGVFNLAVEGMMLLGAFFGVAGVAVTGSAWWGVASGVCAGVITAGLFAWLVLYLGAEQIVTGIAINLLAFGLTGFLLTIFFDVQGSFRPTNMETLPAIHVPVVQDLPVIGAGLSGHTAIVYIALGLVLLAHWVLYRTPKGLDIRAAGEFPEAATSLGISVVGVRVQAVLWSGVVSGLAGAHLALGYASEFSEGMTAARGFTGFIAAVFGLSRPILAGLASLFFGSAEAIGIRVQLEGFGLAPSFLQMFPLVLAIVALSVSSALVTSKARERRIVAHTE